LTIHIVSYLNNTAKISGSLKAKIINIRPPVICRMVFLISTKSVFIFHHHLITLKKYPAANRKNISQTATNRHVESLSILSSTLSKIDV